MDHEFTAALVTDEEIEAASMTGRNQYFEQFVKWYIADRLSRQQLRSHLLDAWIGAEWPRETASSHFVDAGRFEVEAEIVQMFQHAGFLSDGPAVTPPANPMRLYRGCSDEGGGAGFSWTTNPETARWFAQREALFNRDPEEYGKPVIVAATIQPDHVLAIVTDGRNESEVIINPIDADDDIGAGVFFYDLHTPDIPAHVDAILAKRRRLSA